jgi:hypothetical protein
MHQLDVSITDQFNDILDQLTDMFGITSDGLISPFVVKFKYNIPYYWIKVIGSIPIKDTSVQTLRLNARTTYILPDWPIDHFGLVVKNLSRVELYSI